ncbi:MAG TPA: flagellar hook protein FlgE [Pseudomonadales bacterium]|nr:flagellar hook protein FlgE [Pseudomonadales bacterium]HMZ90949.1 flagellar hook protein FlgE [Pseudomonadales bacterium]HNC75911.1 flagellar hook protein FlgE [Pseudomonadales bacterium]HNN66074.1 flagellar hook protein FlgE [Pseudomonadales bacterium]
MSFDTAVSGLRAANTELGVAGNNIANASTTGFKASRAEFGDVYASALVGSGRTAIGNGVNLNKVSQQFSQGNINFTNNSLDLAINGDGFFILSKDGSRSYTRAGVTSLDKDGYLVNSTGDRFQGFLASGSGALAANISDLRIQTQELAPKLTAQVKARLNLDARETPPEQRSYSAAMSGSSIGKVQLGTTSAVTNGYGTGSLQLKNNDTGQAVSLASSSGQSAAAIAAGINALNHSGVSASAQTSVTLSAITGVATGEFSLNGTALTGNTVAAWVSQINAMSGFSAVDNGGGSMTITQNSGQDIDFSITGTGSVALRGPGDSAASTLNAGNGFATVGGTVALATSENYSYVTGSGDGAVFPGTPSTGPVIASNTFDPSQQDSYSHATSATIYDSLGNAHTLSQYFVKESVYKSGLDNAWTLYVKIDGRDVGDPLPNSSLPTQASYRLVFNADGSLDSANSDSILISNWSPKDANGADNGALQGSPGTTLPLPVPSTSSAFVVEMDSSTQYGGPFAVNALSQDGYASGRLSGIEIATGGQIFSRFTNGQSKILGQVALANFSNPQGLSPTGGTRWVETYDSGAPVVNTPGSSSLGVLQSGALEESNADLSNELVRLIVAQRNYQANAKTIQTYDAVTQSLLNLR